MIIYRKAENSQLLQQVYKMRAPDISDVKWQTCLSYEAS
jgi:hypothetical protein